MNGLKQRDALSSLLFKAIRRVQVNQDGLKLNGIHQFLVYADCVNILGGSVDTIKKNAEALVFASNETGLEVKLNTWSCLEIRMQDKITI
jgi:hypothetical protein